MANRSKVNLKFSYLCRLFEREEHRFPVNEQTHEIVVNQHCFCGKQVYFNGHPEPDSNVPECRVHARGWEKSLPGWDKRLA